MADDDLPPTYRNNDPESSVEAGRESASDRAVARIRIFIAACEHWATSPEAESWGLDDLEMIQAAGYEQKDDGMRRRVGELRTRGWITWDPLPEEQQDDPEHVRHVKRKNPDSGGSRNINYLTGLGVQIYLSLI